MGYIPKHALENLNEYQYKGVDKSILSKYVLTPYWNNLVKLWPKWVAPNTITLTGLSLVFINFLTMLYYDPYYYTAKHADGPPNWIYFTWAAGLFMYQSLDAIDGKQARRTKMAGPLGEMFDHGCDAINTTLGALLTCYALNLGRSWWTVASQVATLANFYLTTWEEYHTGQLYLGVFSGPVEGILMIVGIFIVTGFFGPAFWDQGVVTYLGIGNLVPSIPDIPLNELFMYFAAVGLAFNIFTSYLNVYFATHSPNSSPSSSSSKSSLAPYKPFLRLLPFPLSISIHIFWLSAPSPASSTILHSPLFVPHASAFGLQFAHQVGRMILAHLTKRKDMPFWEGMWVLSIVAGLDANLMWICGRPPFVLHSYENIKITVYASLILSFLTYGRFCYLVINDITNFLGIACFTVRKKDKSGVWQAAVPESPSPSPSPIDDLPKEKKH